MVTEGLRRQPPVYDSLKRGPVAVEELRGLFQYRDLIYQLIRRDLVARYKRSVLGIAWTMLQPLGMMAVITLVFAQLFNRVQGFSVYVLCGLTVWNFFSQTTTGAMHQMVWGNTLLHRIYVPRTAFVAATIGTGLVNIVLALIPLLLLMALVGVPIRWSVLLLPYSLLLLAAFSLGFGLLLSTMAVGFPDVAEMYQVVLYAWMYLTPIIYPKDIIPGNTEIFGFTLNLRYWLFNLNPMYHLLELFRLPLYGGTVPNWPTLAMATVIAVVTLIAGWLVFARNADQLVYRT
jgi:ABC-type polysaccharide/polyol phosphate export permease